MNAVMLRSTSPPPDRCVEVAGLAGAEGLVAVGVGDRRGPAIGVDPRDQLAAELGIEKVLADEQGELGARHALDAGLAMMRSTRVRKVAESRD